MSKKTLDGIRKLDEKEIKRSRKIILDYIGGKDSRVKRMTKFFNGGKNKKEPFFFPEKKKMLDSLSVGNKKDIVPKDREAVSGQKIGKSLYQQKEKENLNNREQFKSKPVDGKPPESDKNLVSKSDYNEIMEEIQKIKSEYKANNIKQGKKSERNTAKREKKEENKFQAKRAKEEKKNKQILKKEQRKKKIKAAINKIFNKKNIKLIFKFFVYIIMFFVLLIILSYIIFAILLLKFGLDNNISRKITKYFPVPAVITKAGFINYYDYLETAVDVDKTKLAKKIILNKLAKKYNLNSANREEMSRQLIKDEDINKVAFSRINKIYQLIVAGGNFDSIGKRYGDEFGGSNQNNDYLLFEDKINSLKSGQISNIITTDKGYYILKRDEAIKSTDNNLFYIFVRAITLDEYLKDKINDTRVLILAD